MVKNHSDSKRGNPLPPHGLLFPISSKGSFICTIPDRMAHATAFVTLVVEHWLEREIAQWVHHEGSIRCCARMAAIDAECLVRKRALSNDPERFLCKRQLNSDFGKLFLPVSPFYPLLCTPTQNTGRMFVSRSLECLPTGILKVRKCTLKDSCRPVY